MNRYERKAVENLRSFLGSIFLGYHHVRLRDGDVADVLVHSI